MLLLPLIFTTAFNWYFGEITKRGTITNKIKHEFEQTQGDSEEQESLACCSSQGCKELGPT